MDDFEKTKAQLIAELQACREELKATKRKHDFLEEIINSSDDVIQVLEPDGVPRFMSRSFTKHSGYTLQDLEERSTAEFYPPEDLAYMGDIIRNLLNSPIGTATKFQHRFFHKDGRILILETTSVNRSDAPIFGQVAVTRVINDRVPADSRLMKVYDVINIVFNGINDAVFVHDSSGKLLEINQKAIELLQLPYDREGLASSAESYYWIDAHATTMQSIWQDVLLGQDRLCEAKARNFSDGTIFDAELYLAKISLQGQDFILATLRDISERKRMEQQLKCSLVEKETLLRELHHRVKNNFAVMTSLLRLQYRRIKEQPIIDILKETEFRVKCMGLVHDKLHQSESLEALKVNDYLISLIQNLLDVYACNEKKIVIKTCLESVSFGADTAIPLGFITSELVSNSIKHAFDNGHGGEIIVTLRRLHESWKFQLIISDNGKGLPKNLDTSTLPTLGLNLVSTFARQLGAELTTGNDRGAQFSLVFEVHPDPGKADQMLRGT